MSGTKKEERYKDSCTFYRRDTNADEGKSAQEPLILIDDDDYMYKGGELKPQRHNFWLS